MWLCDQGVGQGIATHRLPHTQMARRVPKETARAQMQRELQAKDSYHGPTAGWTNVRPQQIHQVPLTEYDDRPACARAMLKGVHPKRLDTRLTYYVHRTRTDLQGWQRDTTQLRWRPAGSMAGRYVCFGVSPHTMHILCFSVIKVRCFWATCVSGGLRTPKTPEKHLQHPRRTTRCRGVERSCDLVL